MAEPVLTRHALLQLERRRISLDQVRHVLQTTRPFGYFHEGAQKFGYFDRASRLFVAEANGRVVTVIADVSSGYVRRLRSRR